MATQLQGGWRACELSRHAATPNAMRALLGRRQNGAEEQCGPTDPRTDEERRLGLGLAHGHRAGASLAERKPWRSLSPRAGPPGPGGCLNPAWQTRTSSHPGYEERGQLHAIPSSRSRARQSKHTHVCMHTCLLVDTQVRACMRAKLLHLCPILCNHMDCSLPGSSIHGDSPGRITGVGCCALLQGTFLPGIKLLSLMSPALAGGSFTTWEAQYLLHPDSITKPFLQMGSLRLRG